MYSKFNKIILVDDTHGLTNINNCKLITLMVVDELSRGYPVAWCITNKFTEENYTLFLK